MDRIFEHLAGDGRDKRLPLIIALDAGYRELRSAKPGAGLLKRGWFDEMHASSRASGRPDKTLTSAMCCSNGLPTPTTAPPHDSPAQTSPNDGAPPSQPPAHLTGPIRPIRPLCPPRPLHPSCNRQRQPLVKKAFPQPKPIRRKENA